MPLGRNLLQNTAVLHSNCMHNQMVVCAISNGSELAAHTGGSPTTPRGIQQNRSNHCSVRPDIWHFWHFKFIHSWTFMSANHTARSMQVRTTKSHTTPLPPIDNPKLVARVPRQQQFPWTNRTKWIRNAKNVERVLTETAVLFSSPRRIYRQSRLDRPSKWG